MPLAPILYEKVANPETAKDDLQKTLPDLFGLTSRCSFAKHITNPSTDFYPNSKIGTLDTFLSYYIVPNDGVTDEISVGLAKYSGNSGWYAEVGLRLDLGLIKNDQTSPQSMRLEWQAKEGISKTDILFIEWLYHTTPLTIDINKKTIQFTRLIYERTELLEIPFNQISERKGEIEKFQEKSPVTITDFELADDSPIFGLKFVDKQSDQSFFDLTIPKSIKVSPESFKSKIKEPKYKQRN